MVGDMIITVATTDDTTDIITGATDIILIYKDKAGGWGRVMKGTPEFFAFGQAMLTRYVNDVFFELPFKEKSPNRF